MKPQRTVLKSLKLLTLCASLSATAASAAPYTIDVGSSIFGIVTHKDGLAQSFAHNHLILTKSYNAALDLDQNDLGESSFELNFNVNTLIVDDPSEKIKWRPLVDRLDVLDEEFGNISEVNRASVRSTMLSSEQLDANFYPTIEAKAGEFRENPLYPAHSPFSHLGKLVVTIHGKTVSKVFPLNLTFEGDDVTVESAVFYKFTEFNIEPYSAFFGAVKNKDQFEVIVHVKASKTADM